MKAIYISQIDFEDVKNIERQWGHSTLLNKQKFYSTKQALLGISVHGCIDIANKLHLLPFHHYLMCCHLSFAASRGTTNDSTSQKRVLVHDEENVQPVMRT